MRLSTVTTALTVLALGGVTVACAQTVSPQLLLSQGGTLPPRGGDVLGISVPVSLGRVDINIQVALLNGTNQNVNVYCNPGYGNYLQSGPPQPGNAVWSSNLSRGGDSLTISSNDPQYPTDTNPYFVCSVINADERITSAYQFTATAVPASESLTSFQQQALVNIYQSCCTGPESCTQWNLQNQSGMVNSQFCSFPGQSCSPQGLLTGMDMSGWGLSCSFPAPDIAALTSLTSLKLSNNPNLKGDISDVWGVLAALSNLQQLALINDTGLVGELQPARSSRGICSLGSLTSLDISGMQLTGTLPGCLLNASSQIASLHISDNRLTGTIPNILVRTSPLQELYAFNNRLMGPIPDTLQNASRLVNLDLSSNVLTGTIPAGLGAVPNLMNLVLRTNRLTGSLPASMLQGANIRTVDVKENSLSVLPSNWRTGQDIPEDSPLINLRISYNDFVGSFPTGLMRMPNLTFLVINNNSLSGSLPDDNSMFPALRALNGSNNQFSGSIPIQFGQIGIFQLAPLEVGANQIMSHVFDLSNNRLTGTVPNFLDFDVLQNYVSSGIYLKGNNFTDACTQELQYIPNLCTGNPPQAQSVSLMSPPVRPQLASPPPGSPPAVQGSMRATGSPPPMGPPIQTQSVQQPPSVSGSETQAQPSSGSSGLGAGGIAGIVVGAVAAVCLAAVLVVLAVRCRGRPQSKGAAAESAGSEPGRRGSLHHNLAVKSMPSGEVALPPLDSKPSAPKAPGTLPTYGSGGLPSQESFGSRKSGILPSLGSGLPKLASLGSRQSGFQRFEDQPEQ